MRAIIDLDHSNRFEGERGADNEIDALTENLVQCGLAFCPDRAFYFYELRETYLHKYAVVDAKRLIQHAKEVFFVAGQNRPRT